MQPKRVSTVPAFEILSSYEKKNKKGEYWKIDVFKKNRYIAPDMFEALKKLDELIKINKGYLHIIDLYRSWEMQESARKDFISGKKKAFVAKPGTSFHNAGRAVDISLELLKFDGLQKDGWLEFLWDLAIPLGFRPIIKMPDMNASEAWHFDYPGKDWENAYNKISYSECAKCCILDIGMWNKDENEEKIKKMFVQSQLIRLGHFDIGVVDGIIGSKTKGALNFYNLKNSNTDECISVLTSFKGK